MTESSTIDQRLDQQLDRIYALIEQGLDQDLVQVEYTRAVELLTQKYEGLLQHATENMQKQALQERYAQAVLQLAAAIDRAIERRTQ